MPAYARLLNRLGIIGLDHLEPVLLAALATQSTVLLVGPHGCGKNFIFDRFAQALDLDLRLYNASTLSFDELLGYPIAGEDGELRYLETATSIWSARAVLIDEISRCRPDMQNKLFPIVLERVVQGHVLERLVYCWAAMNPPAPIDADDNEVVYLGSEPLDPALADRFAFVIGLPSWHEMEDGDRGAIITHEPGEVSPSVAAELALTLEAIRMRMPRVERDLGEVFRETIKLLTGPLAQLGLSISGRRGGRLYRNMLATHATRTVMQTDADAEQSSWLALLSSLPQRAEGRAVDVDRLEKMHERAFDKASPETAALDRRLAGEADPVAAAILSLDQPLSTEEMTTRVAKALATAPPGARHALAHLVMNSPATGRLQAAVAEEVATLYATTVAAQQVVRQVEDPGEDYEAWESIDDTLAGLDPAAPDTAYLTNLLFALYQRQELVRAVHVGGIVAAWNDVRRLARRHRRTAEEEGS